MIHESWPWKRELLKDADIIERWSAKASMTERRSMLLERKIFLAAFAMRKLFECEKLSSTFDNRSVQCEAFKARPDARITKINNNRIDDLYDFGKPAKKTVGMSRLLDLIIHSLTFGQALDDDDTVGGFYVTSDRKRDHIWLVQMPAFLGLMRDVGNDKVDWGEWVLDHEKGDYVSRRGSGKSPF